MRISRDCFANFVSDFRTTFVRVSHECRENFHVSRTRRELDAKVLNMFKNSCECREPVAAKFWRIYNAKFSRHSYECRASVARRSRDSLAKTSRLSGEKIKLSDIRTNVERHSHECRAIVVRIEMKISYIRGKVVRHSHDCRATVARYIFKIRRNSRICRINVYSMRLQRESCVYIVNPCREIVANYSRTSLQLSHSSEIGALVEVYTYVFLIY